MNLSESNTSWSGIISKYNHLGSNTSEKQYTLAMNGTTLYFIVRSNSLYTLTTVLPTNEWLHIASTYKDGEMRLYVNGLKVAENLNVNGSLLLTQGLFGSELMVIMVIRECLKVIFLFLLSIIGP